jgi:predicted DCC family thiol-disulfide oxidoreductase YuxK
MIMNQTVPNNKAIVLYDGDCAFCLRSIGILRRLDWNKALSYQNARNRGELPRCGALAEPGRLLEEMHVLTPDRREIFAGFAAFRWIAGRIPLLWPFLPLMYLPGIPRLGQRLYLWVARNRFNLIPCQGMDGACSIPPRRK